MCLLCDPYKPGREDIHTNTEEDAGKFERQRARDIGPDYDADRPTRIEAEMDCGS